MRALLPGEARPSTIRSFTAVLVVAAVGLVMALNLYLTARSIGIVLSGAPAVDWEQYVEAGRRVFNGGELYAVTDAYAYHYSPVLAWLFAPLATIGTEGWRLLHVGAALVLPTWPMRLAVLASWPFWYDMEAGNVLSFVVLTATWALRGNRVATAGYLGLLLLVPRPLMVPVAAWILWRRPEWRHPFVIALAAHLAVVAGIGWADDWVVALIAAGGDVAIPSNVGPSRFIGTLPWLAIGLPLGAWLTLRGRLGLASLAASPYWLPYYLLMLVLDVRDLRLPFRRGRTDALAR